MSAEEQNDKLAKFLMNNFAKETFDPKNPEIGGEGAGDAAIRLLKAFYKEAHQLRCLQDAGVDNWSGGYSIAMQEHYQWEDELEWK